MEATTKRLGEEWFFSGAFEVAGGFVRIVFRRATKGDDSVNEGVNGYVNGEVKSCGEVRRTYNVKRSGPARGLK